MAWEIQEVVQTYILAQAQIIFVCMMEQRRGSRNNFAQNKNYEEVRMKEKTLKDC
jgi:hypothetical protein